MRLKKAIQTVEYSNLAIFIGLFIVVLSFVAKQKDDKVNIFLIVFALPFIFSFLLRMVLINSFLKKSKYPGVFYSVLDKMHLTENLEITLTDDLLNEIYKPSYTTQEFLEENNLKTEIGRSKLHFPIILLILAGSVFGLMYLGKTINIQDEPFSFILVIGLVIINIFFFFKEKKHQNDKHPIVRFEKTGLFVQDFLITWDTIFDWEYYQGGKDSNSLITIHYYNQNKMPAEYIMHIGELNSEKLEILILLTHFKAKYGQNAAANSEFVQ